MFESHSLRARFAAIFALVCVCLFSGAVHAQTFTADWTNLGVSNLNGVPTGSSVVAGPRTVTLSHSTTTNGGPFTPYAPYGNQMVSYYSGQIGTQTGPLLYHMENDSMDVGDRFQTVYTFSGGVTNLAFALSDVDFDNAGGNLYQDGVTIEYDTGTAVWQNVRTTPAFYTLGSVVTTGTLSGVNGFVGNGASNITATNGNINVGFGATSVTRIRITYHFGQSVAGNPTDGLQYIGLSDFTFQVAGTPISDLDLSKTVSNAAPAAGSAISYTLTLLNNGPNAESNVDVRDVLPSGFSYTGTAGGSYGNYNSGTGMWNVPAIASGATRSITLNGTVTAPAGVTISNFAEVWSQTNFDSDSQVANGSTTEDDDASAAFTVQGARLAGTPPILTCPVGTTLFDWDAVAWTAGNTSGSYTVTNIGNISFTLSNPGSWLNNATYGGQSPLRQNVMHGGTTQNALLQLVDLGSQSQVVTTTIALPTAVPGLQFTIFDVDFGTAQFADKVTVTGSYNGTGVTPTLTNGIANYVIGNSAYGDGVSADNQANGNVVVSFSAPVDTITISYGNHSTAPANPGQQAIALHDITFCRPVATLSVSKISSVLSDPISASNPKAIPGATVRYCITMQNNGSGTTTLVSASDTLPANVTYTPGSMTSGASCGSASTAEDDDNSGADETDPYGMSITGTTISGKAASLAPNASFAMAFLATVN
jgi:uncharacterized repeat protein (TIGR01451 family)